MTYGHLPRGPPWPRGPRPQVQKWCTSELGSNGPLSMACRDLARQQSPLQHPESLPRSREIASPGPGTFRREGQQFGERRADRGPTPCPGLCTSRHCHATEPGPFLLPSLSCGRQVERTPFFVMWLTEGTVVGAHRAHCTLHSVPGTLAPQRLPASGPGRVGQHVQGLAPPFLRIGSRTAVFFGCTGPLLLHLGFP